jgi:sec-independent protein translocase protein TatB
MNGFGLSELIVISIVILLFVGPERLPHVVRTVGRTYGRLRRAAEDLRRSLVLEADRLDEEERLRDLRRRRIEAERERRLREGGEGSAEAANRAPGPDSPRPQPAPAPVVREPPAVPAGFTQAEWDELPAHVRDLIQRRDAARATEG